MKVHLVAVGNMKAGPEKTLIEMYQKRLIWSFKIQETVCKKPLQGELLKSAEEALIMSALPADSPYICLDERGRDLNSLEFAALIKQHQDQGEKHLSFVIGGADGLSDGMRRGASSLLSFGRLTWPHMLVRVLLMEQLYRAQQILAGHPYHRE